MSSGAVRVLCLFRTSGIYQPEARENVQGLSAPFPAADPRGPQGKAPRWQGPGSGPGGAARPSSASSPVAPRWRRAPRVFCLPESTLLIVFLKNRPVSLHFKMCRSESRVRPLEALRAPLRPWRCPWSCWPPSPFVPATRLCVCCLTGAAEELGLGFVNQSTTVPVRFLCNSFLLLSLLIPLF